MPVAPNDYHTEQYILLYLFIYLTKTTHNQYQCYYVSDVNVSGFVHFPRMSLWEG